MSGALGSIGNYVTGLAFIWNIIHPQRVRAPGLKDAPIQTAEEGVKIPFGYGTHTRRGHLLYCGNAVKHIRKTGGKGGGPVVETPYYTRNYAIAFGFGNRDGTGIVVVQVKRNGKLVYDITPTSTIRGKNAKFLKRATIYPGSETQGVDPTLEGIFGVGNIQPFLGLCYIMFEDDECPNGAAVDNFEVTVQTCGTVTNLADERVAFLGVSNTINVYQATRTGAWTTINPPGSLAPDKVSTVFGRAYAYDSFTGLFFYSIDDGATWTQSATAAVTSSVIDDIAGASGLHAVAIGNIPGPNPTAVEVWVTTDGGVNWTAYATSMQSARAIAHGPNGFVVVCDGNGNGAWTSPDGITWTQRNASVEGLGICFNGTNFLSVGNHGETWSAPSDAGTWTYGSSPGGANYSFRAVCGQDDYFVAAANAGYGLFRTTDLGVTWNAIAGTTTGNTSGDNDCAASGGGVDVVKYGSSLVSFSFDGGLTFANMPPAYTDLRAIDYIKPHLIWYVVPDAPGLYADEDGNLIDHFSEGSEAETCGTTDGEVTADLCDQVGFDASEYDVSELTDEFDGYGCNIEASAFGYIQPLMRAFNFDRAEFDKKVRFVKRGKAPVAALTMDDLTAREEGPAIVEDLIDDETVLLRKINVLTVNPAANYSTGKQTWERTASTIQAVGESTFDLPIVCPSTLGAQIADIQGKIAWSEYEKRDFGLTVKHAYLTPTDVVTLTDHAAKTHRLRFEKTREERMAISVEGAIKDRASTYQSNATGVDNPNVTPPNEGLVGPTLLALMNLVQLRNQDATPGIYVGMAGVLAGWPGAQLLMSVDGGVSYDTVLTVNIPTIMGRLTADVTSSSEPLSVRVFGGDLSSKTTAQVDAGANYSAVITAGVTEVLAYEDATATATHYYDLETLTRGLEGSNAADHASGDTFVDLATAYFVPISQDYAGQTLYFKAVGLGLSPDAIDAVAFVYEGWEFIEDGGEIT